MKRNKKRISSTDIQREEDCLVNVDNPDAENKASSDGDAEDKLQPKIQPKRLFKTIVREMIYLPKWHRAIKVIRKNVDLLQAIQENKTERVTQLLNEGVSQNATYRWTFLSACHIAAFFGRDTVLDELIKRKANFQIKDAFQRQPIEFAAWEGHWKCVDILSKAEKPNDFSTIPLNHLAPLHCPIIKGEIPKILTGFSALHLASACLHLDCVQTLLRNCPDLIFAKNNEGLTPFDLCGRKFVSGPIELNDSVKIRFAAVIKEFIDYKERNNIIGDVQDSMKNYEYQHLCYTPLHIAAMLDDENSIQLLCQKVGAFFGCKNKNGETPLHTAAIHRKEKSLMTLISIGTDDTEIHDNSGMLPSDNRYYSDMVDNESCTSLHLAIKYRWLTGVQILLETSNVILRDKNKKSILHLAIEAGDVEILEEFLKNQRVICKLNNLKDDRNSDEETPLYTAIRCKSVECVKALLRYSVSCEVKLNDLNVFHKAAEAGNTAVMLELLKEYNIDIEKKICESGGVHKVSPLHLAAEKNNFECIEALFEGIFDRIKLHQKSYAPPYSSTERNSQRQEWLPFHVALKYGFKESIAIFLKYDADISQFVPTLEGDKEKALDLITSKMHNPVDYLGDLCSSCIQVNKYHLDDPKCEITMDYTFLLPPASDNTVKEYGKGVMRIVKVLTNPYSNYDLKRLILHPLIESFQHMQYTALRKFFIYILLTYCCFVIVLTVSVIIEYKYKDSAEDPPTFLRKSIWYPILWFTMFLVFIQESLFISAKKMERLKNHETIIKLGSLSLSMIFTIINHNVTSVFPRYVTAGAILLAWVEIIILLARFPEFGYLYQMFTTVALRVVKVMSLFGCFLIIGFSLAFWVLFDSQPPFDGPWNSIVKTIVMMTSEFDYSDLASTWAAYPSFPQILFVAFLISMPIVVMNLLVAVAVSDTKDLLIEGKIQRLIEQLEFLSTLDLIGCTTIWTYFPEFIRTYKKTELVTSDRKKIIIIPSKPDKKLTKSILESIFKEAVNQKNKKENVHHTTVTSKMDDIQEALKIIMRSVEKKSF